MNRIVFSHGNSFPSGTYSALFEHLRARGFEVSAVDRLIGAGLLPALVDPVWNSAWLLDDSHGLGSVLAAMGLRKSASANWPEARKRSRRRAYFSIGKRWPGGKGKTKVSV